MHHSKTSPDINHRASSAATSNELLAQAIFVLREIAAHARQEMGRWAGLFGTAVRRLWVSLVEQQDAEGLYAFSEPVAGYRVRHIPNDEITTDERLALGLS